MENQVERFLQRLSELSRETGIGITGSPVLFELEADDQERAYTADGESNLKYE
jgi:hypothetical protein